MKDLTNKEVESKKSIRRSDVAGTSDETTIFIKKVHERAETITPLLRKILEASHDSFEQIN